MKKIIKLSFLVFPIISLASLLQFCTPAGTANKSTGYQEDLSVYRPKYEIVENSTPTEEYTSPEDEIAIAPEEHIKSELDSVISIMIDAKKDIRYVDGFTIQLYSGISRDKANAIKSRIYELKEDLSPRVSYDQPNYRVKIGRYYSRLDANADFSLLKKKFSRAVLIPTRIKLKAN